MIPLAVRAELEAQPLAVHHQILARAYIRGDLSNYAFRRLIPRAWARAGGIFVPGDAALTLGAIEMAGFVADDMRAWESLPDPLTIYRGAVHPGPCWTTKIEVAKCFLELSPKLGRMQTYASAKVEMQLGLDRHVGEPILYEHVVAKENVVAYITGRREHEIILSRRAWRDMNGHDFA